MLDTRTRRVWAYRAAIATGALVAIAGSQLLARHVHAFHPPSWPLVALLTASATAVGLYSFYWGWRAWRARDEFEQSGRLSAWCWGGALGLLATAPVFAFCASGGLSLLVPGFVPHQPARIAFMAGYLLPCLFQVTGYFVALGLFYRSR